MKNILKKEIGSITLYVLVSMLFLTMFLATTFTLSTNNEIAQRESTEKIKEIYQEGTNNIDAVYAKVKESLGPEQKEYEFAYTGSYQTFVAPANGVYQLQVWGAQGGYRSSSSYGGKGGYSTGNIALSKGDTLYVYVGGKGGNSSTKTSGVVAGGYNGGGYRYGYCGGGGATDIRFKAGVWNNSASLLSRVIVAGGGGSDGATTKKGMYGGGTIGGSSTENYTANKNYCGIGGNQTYSGYSTSYTITTQATSGLTSNSTSYYCGGFGFGGGGVNLSSGYGGAGGGGWYGGSGTVPDSSGDDDRGGGGGSGFVWTSATSGNVPSGYSVSTKYYLTDASTINGASSFVTTDGTSTETGHSGNGYAKITWLRFE